ncbi:MAG: hypothetical protein Rhims3KO_05890 [Hyphomicrobiales bacterium]
MKTYSKITAKDFPAAPGFCDALERWIADERHAIANGLSMPDPKPCLIGFPCAWAGEEGVAIPIRSGCNQPGQTPREFDTAIALALFLCTASLKASLCLEPVRKRMEGGGQLYPKLQLGSGEGRNFKVARITKDTPAHKITKPLPDATHYDCRAANLFIARPEDHHQDPYQAGKGRFITVALSRYDDLAAKSLQGMPITRKRFERLLRGLLEVHTMREQQRLTLQAA